ncbi:glycine-rich domain-containing protein [Mycobacteroides abscessus]|uniref:glycine-rich domain-containing protein n=1 Tax=Mycobacteroides abscessus TaxID=36809 RepID=UPI00092C7DD9|nr:hypothetical protein [Mycobacteroides abscessus]SHR34557.1 Uncharacterised protein [Mycobacteroides abscessus subsp. abscessus]SHR80802.1 Uncharacterised protein [Mycobacteroides abscessus subsp. abscessus]SHS09344.1 Uncharacterised protein [Mycobacteroides abscessus subsp. abscessus]SHS45048.1 Uncharacterised protein [Mycobacteroides abscessus subsp. abscessus]SHS63230.1 Uncharacterised protein [Mycobacteroides abscessus subsp. abscessus]
MPWTPNPSASGARSGGKWSPNPVVPQKPTGGKWHAIIGINASLAIMWVSEVELTAMQAIGVVQSVHLNRQLALAAVYQLAIERSILVTRNLQLQATFQQDLALAVTMERALFLAKVIGCDLAQAVSMTGTISLQRVAPIDLTCNLTAPRSISFEKILPVAMTRTITMSSSLVLDRVAKIDAALTITTARACSLGYPPGGLPALANYTSAGAFTHNIVRNCDYMDAVGCGAGGGGGGGDGGLGTTGQGGRKGSWNARTVARNIDIPGSALTLTGVVGSAGTAGAKEKDGGPGGDTTFLINGVTTTCAGGAGGKGAYAGNGLNQPGEAAGDTTVNGQTYSGGAQAGTNTNGNAPGGGGGPGSGGAFGIANPGRIGGIGRAHIRSYQ